MAERLLISLFYRYLPLTFVKMVEKKKKGLFVCILINT